MLSKFVDENQKNWDEHLPLLMAHITSVNETTGCTPSGMMIGREATLPIDVMLGRPESVEVPSNETKYAQSLRQRIDLIHDFARKHLQIESDRQKRYYDHLAQQHSFKQGDAVWLHNLKRKKGLCPKLQRPWDGPYIVIKCIDDLVYRIQKGARGKPRVVHTNRLKRYEGADVPDWFQDVPEEHARVAEGPGSILGADAVPTNSMSSTLPSPGSTENKPPSHQATAGRLGQEGLRNHRLGHRIITWTD